MRLLLRSAQASLLTPRALLSPDLVLLSADLVKHALPFADELNQKVENRLIADVIDRFYPSSIHHVNDTRILCPVL